MFPLFEFFIPVKVRYKPTSSHNYVKALPQLLAIYLQLGIIRILKSVLKKKKKILSLN